MKTIEEFKNEYCNQYSNESEKWIAEDAILKTVAFAQRWISVEDALPEEDGFYLCRLDWTKVCEVCLYVADIKFWNTGGVVSWRQIELE